MFILSQFAMLMAIVLHSEICHKSIFCIQDVPDLLSELAVPLLVAAYNLILPYMFTVITNLEKYKNPRTSLYVALAR